MRARRVHSRLAFLSAPRPGRQEPRSPDWNPNWKASTELREAIEFHFNEDQSFDAAADVRDSEENLARRRDERAAARARKPWWMR